MTDAAVLALAEAGLAGCEEKSYLHLSEGQKQLCILARTLVSDGKLLLLDEPESALDFRYRHQMLTILRDWVSKGDRSAVVSLHDPTLALNFCDKLLLLADSEILGIIDLRADSLDKMEQMLNMIYGPISLQRCLNRKGDAQLVMLREE